MKENSKWIVYQFNSLKFDKSVASIRRERRKSLSSIYLWFDVLHHNAAICTFRNIYDLASKKGNRYKLCNYLKKQGENHYGQNVVIFQKQINLFIIQFILKIVLNFTFHFNNNRSMRVIRSYGVWAAIGLYCRCTEWQHIIWHFFNFLDGWRIGDNGIS